MSRIAAAGVIAILVSGVAACGSAFGPAAKPAGAGQQAQTPQQAMELAANISRTVNSFTANMTVRLDSPGGAGTLDLDGTISEQLHPSLLAEADYSKFGVTGQSFPGGMAEIITPSAVYIKLGKFTKALGTNKPWIAIPFSALSKITGVNLTSLFNQLQSSSPLNQSQLFAGATNVRVVGTGVIDGVPVTEYKGSVSMSKALAKLPKSLRTSLGTDIKAAGINTADFTEWLDAQHQVRKVVVTETGSTFSETITTTVTSFNQPVNIHIPSAGQTTSLPASFLNSTGA
jgi:hypothetical protein